MIRQPVDPALIARYTRAGLWDNTFIDSYIPRFAAAEPDAMAVIDRNRTWTYTELDTTIAQVAASLTDRGVGPGDVVSWQLPNWAEAIVVHHAAMRIGAVSNPIIPIFRESEVGFILRQAESKVVFFPDSFRGFDFAAMYAGLADEVGALEHAIVVPSKPAGPHGLTDVCRIGANREQPSKSRAASRNPNDVMLLLYTSGTTSSPKGALHTHNTLDYENRSIIDFYDLTSADVVFMPSPLGHITGVLYGMQLPFMLGSAVVLQDVWNPAVGLSNIEKFRCSFIVAATPFLHGLTNHPEFDRHRVASLRAFACGGADVPPDLIIGASEHTDAMIGRVYGSTEYPTATGSTYGDTLDRRARTDGRPIGSAEVQIRDANGAEVAPGESGELFLRGPELFVGYLDSTLNAEAFDADGWFATGDLAKRDTQGYIEITGRLKDIIIRGGENISAKEIEDHLFEHPMIADVAVVAVPDPVLVEKICAVVVTEGGAQLSLNDITSWLRGRRIAIQKLPERLVLVEELPRTASGKIQKFRIRDTLM